MYVRACERQMSVDDYRVCVCACACSWRAPLGVINKHQWPYGRPLDALISALGK